MAFNPGIEQEEDKTEQGQEGGTNQLGSSGGGIITGQTAEEGQAQKGKGSGFVNIGSYLDANKDDIPGQTDKVVNKVASSYDKANKAVTSSQTGFNDASSKNRVGLGDLNTTADDKQVAADALRNDDVLDESDQSKFASWQNMSYAGPTELQNTWGGAQKEADDLSTSLQSGNGYYPAMAKTFGDGSSDYSSGMQRLDASLLSADPNSRSRIADTGKASSAATQANIASAQDQARQVGQQYVGEAESARNAANSALTEYLPEYFTGLTNQVAQTNTQRQGEYEAARQGGGDQATFSFANPNDSSNVADFYQYDMTPTSGYVPTTSLSASYVNPNRADFTTYGGDVGIGSLDPTQIAKLEALYAMTGDPAIRSQLEASAASTLGFDDVMRGGGQPAYTFNQTGYDQSVQQAQTTAQQQAIAAENARMDAELAAQQKALDDLEEANRIHSSGQIDQSGGLTHFRIPSSL